MITVEKMMSKIVICTFLLCELFGKEYLFSRDDRKWAHINSEYARTQRRFLINPVHTRISTHVHLYHRFFDFYIVEKQCGHFALLSAHIHSTHAPSIPSTNVFPESLVRNTHHCTYGSNERSFT